MGIAQSVLDSVEEELRRRPGAMLRKIGLRIGELAGVDSDSLSFSFQCLASGTLCETAELAIEASPWRRRCPACSREFHVVNYRIECPECGSAGTENAGGDELEIAWLELEQP